MCAPSGCKATEGFKNLSLLQVFSFNSYFNTLLPLSDFYSLTNCFKLTNPSNSFHYLNCEINIQLFSCREGQYTTL